MLITAVLLVVFGVISAQNCGRRPLKPDADDDKIVGGAQALRGDWPWSCSMQYNGRHICGGSLISNKWIITAAHCVSSTVASNYKWKCGDHDRNIAETYTQTLSVSRVIPHPSYNSRLIQNDVALMEVTPAAVATDHVSSVCYPAIGEDYNGKTSWATGWGTLVSGGTVSRYHMEVAMPVLSDADCKAKFGGTNNMLNPATQVCAGVKGANKDTCQGDSGGPLVVKHNDGRWYLIGLTSWGYGCGDGGVYTRTSAFRTWVEGFTGPL